LPVALAAKRAGAEVTVVAGDSGQGAAIRAHGLGFVRLPISRKGMNPLVDFWTTVFLMGVYHELRPDLVHHSTPKAVLYGTFASRVLKGAAVVNTISGLGYVFSSSDLRARLARPLLRTMYGVALRHPRSRTIFQNADDLNDFVRLRMVRPDDAVLVRGSGVDCERFRPSPEPPGQPVVLLASRMLWDKGLSEFVTVARELKGKARFVLVGAPDPGNPKSVLTSQLEAWADEGAVEWWKQRDNMPEVFAQSSIVVLPTVYGEGVPKVLLEAAAAGRPIVATAVRGCIEIVKDGVNGILVPKGSLINLTAAIERLLDHPELRLAYGNAGREIALSEFSEESVVTRTLALYQDLLMSKRLQ